jgi:hypothetical protein
VTARSLCLACGIRQVGERAIEHLPSCAVGRFLRLLDELRVRTSPRPLVTGLAEREIVLDPVPGPTAVELA